jgi:hypothetical protein
MSEVSNRTIVALLAVALVITVFGTVVSVSKLNEMGERYAMLSGAATSEEPLAEEAPIEETSEESLAEEAPVEEISEEAPVEEEKKEE